jgi:tetratricopeptide (TPR) repeat protein
VAEAAGRPGDARSALERALSLDPTNTKLAELLRRMYEAVGAHRELAELLLHDAGQSKDDEARLQALLGAASFLLEEDDEAERAIEVLEQARQLAPQDLDVATLLARAYAGLGRQQEALMILEDAANNQRGRRQKGLVSVYVEMANILQESDAAAEALQALTKAHELDLKNPHLAMRLGRLALTLGEDQQALRAFRSVTIMKPNEEVSNEDIARMKGDAHYHLALLAERQGDPRKAKILCSKALSEDPSHEGATQLLEQLSQS